MPIDPTNRSSYLFGEFRVDGVERVLTRRGERVPLTPKVFDLLLLLVENRGHVIEKERLMGEIWPHTFVEEGNLTQNISVLRKTLSHDGQQYIQTVPRRGYRFIGQVRETRDEGLLIEEHSLTRVVVQEAASRNGSETVCAVDSTAKTEPSRIVRLSWRKMALISAAALIGITAVGAGWLVLSPRKVSSRTPPPFSVNNVTLRTITSTGNVVYGVMSDDGEFVVYSTVDDDNRYALWLQRIGSREVLQLIPPTTHQVGPAAISHNGNWIYYGESNPLEPLKGPTIYRMPLLGGSPRRVLDSVHLFAALSPDDQRILVHRFKASGGIDLVTVNALDGGDEVVIASSNIASDYLGTRWSPDGSKLLFFSSEQRPDGTYWSISEMPAQGGPHKTILPPAQRKIWFIGWADNGRGIIMNATDPVTRIPQLYYVSYPDGETRRITNDLVGYTSISVGGETIMAGKVERQSRIWLTNWPNPGTARQAIDRDMNDGFAWMSDGHLVYDTSDDGRSHLWLGDPAGSPPQQLSPDNAEERQPDVSPDGKLIAFISKRSGVVGLWIMDADGRNPRRLTADSVQVWRPRFAPDGQSIFCMLERNDHPTIARIAITGGEPATIADDVYGETFFDISPDGQRLAYSIKDLKRHVTQVVVRPLGGGAAKYFDIEPSYFLRWTPDGRNLAYAQYPQDKRFGEALWLQPVDGGPPQQVLDLTPDLLYWAAWSRDGKQLAISHGRFVRDIVLVSRNKTAAN